MSEHPLHLPKGSVRALLAILVVGGAVLLELLRGGAPEWVMASATVVLGFYFGARSAS